MRHAGHSQPRRLRWPLQAVGFRLVDHDVGAVLDKKTIALPEGRGELACSQLQHLNASVAVDLTILRRAARVISGRGIVVRLTECGF